MLAVVLGAEAQRELVEAIAYLNGDGSGMGDVFRDAVEVRLQRLAHFPRMGRLVGRKARRFVMRGWRYSIIYSIERDHLFVAAVAHHSRRPGYWRRRLR